MIFDERDIEKVETKEEKRKQHKVAKSQLSFDAIESGASSRKTVIEETSKEKPQKQEPKTAKAKSKAKKFDENKNLTEDFEQQEVKNEERTFVLLQIPPPLT